MAQSIGKMIDKMYELREQKRALEKDLKDIEDKMKEMDAEIMAQMDDEDMPMARGQLASASIAETVIAEVDDWDTFYDNLKQTDRLYLLQRRVSNAAWNELRLAGELVPGTKPLTRRRINLRKVTN